MGMKQARRSIALIAFAALGWTGICPSGALATHTPEDGALGWIAQAGSGGESEAIMRNFSLRTVLFDPARFGTSDGAPRPGFTRYTAWGVVDTPLGGHLMTIRAENGTHWGDPIPNLIRNLDGDLVPFLLNDHFADVVFRKLPSSGQGDFPFIIYWRAGDPEDGISTIHRALSTDGIVWESETPIVQSSDLPPTATQLGPGGKPLLGSPLAESSTLGPSDAIYNSSGSTATRCGFSDPQSVNPWRCRWVLIYDAHGVSNVLRLAGSADGLIWYGTSDPILKPGPSGSWDDGSVTLGHLRPGTFTLYYSGGAGSETCAGDDYPCWSIGIADSEDGIGFDKASFNPATPRQLLDIFADDDPGTLWNAQVVADGAHNGSGHDRIYYARISKGDSSTSPRADTYVAFDSPPPLQAPTIRISSPIGPFRNQSATPIELYITDTLGAQVGLDLGTLRLKIDGTIIPGGWSVSEPHLVGAFKFPSTKVSAPSGSYTLPDGLHTFSVEVNDHDGNTGIASTFFIVDTTPPTTTLTSAPQDGHIGFPSFTGMTIEPEDGTVLFGIDVLVTDPLGQSHSYAVPIRPDGIKSEKEWVWRWVVPSDPHFLLPGFYTYSFRALDIAKNRESATEANTVTVLII